MIWSVSTSALSTAVAVGALSLVRDRIGARGPALGTLIAGGLRWLAEHQNADGGWGDTVKSVSNISTTMLCRAAGGVSLTFVDETVMAELSKVYQELRPLVPGSDPEGWVWVYLRKAPKALSWRACSAY